MSPTKNLQSVYTSDKLYSYINNTSRLQIIRIVNHPARYFERVVFPGQRLLFESPPDFELEIYTNDTSQAILIKKIPSFSLEVALSEAHES